MEPTLDFARSLIEAGGWTVVVLLVTLGIVGLWRRWWVPGFWFDERGRALDAAAKAITEMTAANVELRIENARLRADVTRERRRRRDDA